MKDAGLFDGFESYRVPDSAEIESALRTGMLALDTNVLLNLYRYSPKTVDDLVSVVEAASSRLFVPHQVVREFWRNRQAVIAGLGSVSRDMYAALRKNEASTVDAIGRWAKATALPAAERDALMCQVSEAFAAWRTGAGDSASDVRANVATSKDKVLKRIESLLKGRVGPALDEQAWVEAIAEGQRRVEEKIPPGYHDAAKLESDLEEGASGDYIVWAQLLLEGARRKTNLVFVTADAKEDWWNRAAQGLIVGPRRELVIEYLQSTGERLFLLEPADLITHSSVLGVGTSTESVQDIQRVRDEEPARVPWTVDAAQAVLKELNAYGFVQAEVIREAIRAGGRITRARVYELDERDPGQMLRGFTRPVNRITAEMQSEGSVPYGVSALLEPVYEAGVKVTYFVVPHELVELFAATDDA